MNSRERFNHTMCYEPTDRPPLFEDGIREEVLYTWHRQGLGKKDRLESLFTYDLREEVEPDLEPIPVSSYWPKSLKGLQQLARRLNPSDAARLPVDWGKKVIDWKLRKYPLILRIHRGYFLTMGVHGWKRFTESIQLLVDDPLFVEAWLNIYAELSMGLVERILKDAPVDAVLFSEPIGGNHGPLISPAMYASMILKSYLPILDLAKARGVKTIIYRTYANSRVLLPSVVKAGFNCLWACECNPQAMDYQAIHQEYGKDLRLIGGIDSDALRQNPHEIERAVLDVVPKLLADGGYIPLVDGRVRDDVPFANYSYYRKLLESLTACL